MKTIHNFLTELLRFLRYLNYERCNQGNFQPNGDLEAGP